MLKHTQTRFWAVNMGRPPEYDPLSETEYMVRCSLDEAEYDGAIANLASTYRPADDTVQMGIGCEGQRIIDFAPVLQADVLPLTDVLRALKATCEEMLGTMVEVEFAVRLDRKGAAPAEFGFLQVRPMVVSHATVEVSDEELRSGRTLLASSSVLGNGVLDDLRDIVYVDPDEFDVMRTPELVPEFERVNGELVQARRPYLLIGFGRWGTTDPLGGIPVEFGQISGAKVIVESPLASVPYALSQGSHFFHNVTSFRIFYFSVQEHEGLPIDWEWLRAQPARRVGSLVKHVELPTALLVKVDGRSGRGVVLHG